jgi:hypothetical protein
MSDEEYLARSSRRTREAKATVDAQQPPLAPVENPNPAPPDAAETAADAELDLSSLPPIESITAATDVAAFLRKGIPPELSRAALRRAWAADPAIRDFIGLAESAWDFNDPNAMPGFGPLDCSAEQLAALLDRVVGGARTAADQLATAVPEQAISEQKDGRQSADSDREPLLQSDAPAAAADLGCDQEISSGEASPAPAAVQPAPNDFEDDRTPARRRTHGSALPR